MGATPDLLGADNVLDGRDRPIVSVGPIAGRLADALRQAKLTLVEQAAVASGNARRFSRLKSL